MISSRFLTMTTPALAACLCAGVATAQYETRDRDQDQRERQRQTGQPGEGDDLHPLWRHPVDDREQWQTQDRWMQGRGEAMQERGATGDTYRTAYWEGYHDGYDDDEFGAEHWSGEWDQQYSSAYTDGYYDGYYDQQLEYGYDPNYYIYSVAIVPTGEAGEQQAERRRGEQRRQGDQVRTRGDREMATGSAQRVEPARRDLERIAALKLVRGDISEISEAERSDRPDHTVLSIDFQDREKVTADFGPHMSRDRIPFERGDRVSLVGYHKKSDQGETIVVSQIVHEGQVYKLRGAGGEQRDGPATRRREMEREGDRNRPGGG